MAVLPGIVFDKDSGVVGADLLLHMCNNVLAQALVAVPAFYFTGLPRLNLVDADKQARFEHGGIGSCNSLAVGCMTDEPCLASHNSMINSSDSEEHNPSTCKVHEETLEGPDTNTRLISKEMNAWLVVCKNKDDDDDDEDEEDDEDEDDDDDDADEEDVGDDGEGEGDVDGHGGDGGGDEEDEEDENGEGDDDEEDEDAVEGEDDEDEDGVEDEEDEDEDDEDDEPQEPPTKKRK